jgi:methionyl-tRNA formyltransferase
MTRIKEFWKTIVFCDETSYLTVQQLAKQAGLMVAAIVFSQRVQHADIEYLTEYHAYETNPRIFHALDQDVIARFARENSVDFLLVFSFDTILREEILQIDEVKKLNIHCGKLPKYRGANILNWVIIKGEPITAVTLHEIDSGVDTGPIIADWDVEVYVSDTPLILQSRLEESILSFASKKIIDYLENRIVPKPQDQTISPSFKRRSPEDGLIDWSQSNIEIYNLIRGLANPWPGARYVDENNQLQIVGNVLSLKEIETLRKRLGN